VRLTVTDDGRGFKVEQAFRSYAGRWGLLGMRERADRIGGTLRVRSAPDRGTVVELRVSLSAKTRRRGVER
jgi:two-component system sensor histidine kinase NreB